MYVALILLALTLGVTLMTRGLRRGHRLAVGAGLTVLLGTGAFFGFLSFWGELLWFEALGYEQRFWTEVLARLVLTAAGGGAGALVVYLLTLPIAGTLRVAQRWAGLVGALFGISWGLQSWESVLRFWHRVGTGVSDPILGRDAGFYLFTLPVLDGLYDLALALTVVAVVAAAAATLLTFGDGGVRIELPGGRTGPQLAGPGPRTPDADLPRWALPVALAGLALVTAAGKLLGVYHLLYSELGAVAGPGWTDVHIRLPAYYVAAVATVLGGLASLVPAVRHRLGRWAQRSFTSPLTSTLPRPVAGLAVAWALILLVWSLGLAVLPGLVQWLRVEPNEISLERPYITHNIAFTRRAFGLGEADEVEFPASGTFTRETAADNRRLLDEIRLWDWRALDAVYKQFQEIRLYYEFADVDIDRYQIGERYRQVMVSARELEPSNLPLPSQTFVNRRFKYTHGHGLTLAPVSDFTPAGLPNLLIRDIPPVSEHPSLEVTRPEIYYGELTDEPVYVNTEEAEFDYPSGDENVYTRYAGTGGVELGSGLGFWFRKFLFGWKFDGTRFLLSGYPTGESRVLYHREVAERVERVAPFLELDEDPYIVLADGRLHWIVDAYTTSDAYPYSTPFDSREVIEFKESGRTRRFVRQTTPYLDGHNYLRNSVKAVVDAYDGSVDLYIFAPDDPLIRVWDRVYPGLMKPREAMPEAVRAHVRYPTDYLLAQGLVYAKYHMNDPTVFYNQEDLWTRATEKYYGDVQPVEPYYVMWERPGSDAAEFVLILPFTPKNRQVLIGWIAGMCDPPHYGRFLAYKFPKEEWILGPQQVETKIDQDRHLSGQLTLWDQRGSQVIRGNVLAIPLDQSLLYVEPIYLQAETAAYPELRLVAVMHGDTLSYGESFEQALNGLFADGAPPGAAEAEVPGATPTAAETARLARRAQEAFDAYRRLQGEGRFEEAGRELATLQALLERLAGTAGGGEGEE